MVACGVMADEGDAVPPGMEVMRDQMEYTAPDGTARAATTLATASMNTATRSATTGRPRIRQAVHGREHMGSLWQEPRWGAPSTSAAFEPGRPVHAGRSGIVDAVGPLAQLVAHLHDAQGVVGSSPARPTQKYLVGGYFLPEQSVSLVEHRTSRRAKLRLTHPAHWSCLGGRTSAPSGAWPRRPSA